MVDESVYLMRFVLEVIYEPDINPSINVDFFLDIIGFVCYVYIVIHATLCA